MAKYRDNFNLDLRDIELIESAIRAQISQHARLDLVDPTERASCMAQVRELNLVLAKIFHQKMFYSQVNPTGVPGG